MKKFSFRSINRRWPLLACAALVSLGFFSTAEAQHGGGGHGGGGGHFSGGGGHFAGGGRVGGGGHFVGGGYGRYRGGYGGGRYGGRWGGRYGGWGGGYGWGFGAGLGLGLYFSALPLYYSTYWWGGVPYYYADDNYYTWDGSAGEYQTVSPPPEVEQQAQSQAGSELIAYPKNGQSDQQQAKDKSDCKQWATKQSGYNPSAAATGAASNAVPSNQWDYQRAQAACLEGRGYSVKYRQSRAARAGRNTRGIRHACAPRCVNPNYGSSCCLTGLG